MIMNEVFSFDRFGKPLIYGIMLLTLRQIFGSDDATADGPGSATS